MARGTDSVSSPPAKREVGPLTEVPRVIGLTRFHARNVLFAAGLAPFDSERSREESREKRGTDSLHDGERVVSQKPSPGEKIRKNSTVQLDYSFVGKIDYSTEEDNGYLGTLFIRDEEGELHSDDGPAFVDSPRKGVYTESWHQHGVMTRDGDLPAKRTYEADGTVLEYWYQDGEMIRSTGLPAAILRKGEDIWEMSYRAIIDGKNVMHNSEGPAVIQTYPGQERKEIYFFAGEEVSKEEWEGLRASR